jgi:hypothetical protein
LTVSISQSKGHVKGVAFQGAFIFGGDTPSRRLLLKVAACSVKSCGRVRPEIRTHSKKITPIVCICKKPLHWQGLTRCRANAVRRKADLKMSGRE